MSNLNGKRFIFSITAIICATAATMYLKYSGDMYIKLVLGICAVYTGVQSLTDMKKGV